MSPPRPLDTDLPGRLGLFLAVTAAAFLTVPLPPRHEESLPELAAAGGLAALVVFACLIVPWKRLPAGVQALPPLVFFAIVALLREAEGGATSGMAPLVLLPVLWLALHGTGRQLVASIALAAMTVLGPLVTLGSPNYPPSEWQRALLLTIVATAMGLVVHRLVAEIRGQSEVQDAVARVARVIASDGDARKSICDAARRVAGAAITVLMEPDQQGNLVSTAISGIEMRPISLRMGSEPSGAVAAYLAGESFFVDKPGSSPAVSQRLVAATGAKALVFEPVLRGDDAAGVLIAIWREPLGSLPPRSVSAIRLLAIEAAVAIERAEAQRHLEELARTDPLTGLPNRRTWEDQLSRELARARRDDRPLTVALLDLDRFKWLNDEQGHAVGDRLLKEVAAAWNAHLRDVDLLVRYGGDEFAVLLPDCRLEDARNIIDRLRAATPSGTTCSAGIASWAGFEDPRAVVHRADQALYEAKRGGRDRIASALTPEAPTGGELDPLLVRGDRHLEAAEEPGESGYR